MILADKAYDADAVRAFARPDGGRANIPPRRTRRNRIRFSPIPYRARNRIERFLNRIQRCRRIAAR
jgi:transposase